MSMMITSLRHGVGHRQHYEIYVVPWTDQLNFRLCNLRDAALRVRRLEQSRSVPDGLVCRIAADADIDHPHNPHGKNPVSPEPREQLAGPDNHPSGRSWRAASLFSFRLRAFADHLLACRVCDHPGLLRARKPRQDMVRSTLGALSWRPKVSSSTYVVPLRDIPDFGGRCEQ